MDELVCTVFRAELRAVDVLRCACSPPTIHTDNQQVVVGWHAGKFWPCASNRDGADPWKLFWALVANVGYGIRFVKEAHASHAQVQVGAISKLDWCGNGLAGEWAKLAYALAVKASPVTEYRATWAASIA